MISHTRLLRPIATFALSAVLALGLALPAFAAEGLDAVASEEDYGSRSQIDDSGLTPITADDIADGTYFVIVETDSSMFKITGCELTVEDGHMSAVMSMSSTAYPYLFAGSAEDAAAADLESLIPGLENEQGLSTYTFDEIPALDSAFECSSYSKRKEQWYGHEIMLLASSLPADALTPEARDIVFAEGPLAGLVDGTYTIGVDANDATAELCSPATLTVEGGSSNAVLEWNTGDYDAMAVNGQTYEAVHAEPTVSTFTIPAQAFDISVPVIITTHENGEAEELPCSISLHSGTIELVQAAPGAGDESTEGPNGQTASDAGAGSGGMGTGHIIILVVIAAAVVIALVRSAMKKRNG